MKIDVIPIEVVYAEKTIKDLAKIKANSSVLRILAQPYVRNACFIIAQLRNWARAPGVQISWVSVCNLSEIKQLLDPMGFSATRQWLIFGFASNRIAHSRNIYLILLSI